jgi:hypothetical protein
MPVLPIRMPIRMPILPLRRRIVHIAYRIILKRPVEPGPLVGLERGAVLQALDQVRVAGEGAAVQEGVVAAVLEDAPRVGLVPAAGGEEGRRAEDLAEAAQVDVEEAPAAEEVVFLLVAEDLLVALGMCVSYALL